MNMTHTVLAGAGGTLGALLRYGVGRWYASRGRPPLYATLTVNLAGSFAIGVLIGIGLRQTDPAWYALLGTGVLGGLTTYSTLNVQKAVLAGERRRRALGIYLASTYLGGWLLTAAGFGYGTTL